MMYLLCTCDLPVFTVQVNHVELVSVDYSNWLLYVVLLFYPSSPMFMKRVESGSQMPTFIIKVFIVFQFSTYVYRKF